MLARLALWTTACVVALACSGVAACSPGADRLESPQEEEMSQPTIEEVQDAHTEEWMALPGVVGTGIGLCDGEPCIRVFLSRPSPETEEAIPSRVEGYPVDVRVTGEIEPR